jgi:hypothetical protein
MKPDCKPATCQYCLADCNHTAIGKSFPKLKANEYQCSACGEIYEYGWSDDEAQAEYEENFPTYAKRNDPVDIVCDDCYLQLIAWKSPQEAESEASKAAPLPADSDGPVFINGTKCPACKLTTLFVGSGGYITCGNLECKNPDYEAALQAIIAEKERVARIEALQSIFGMEPIIGIDRIPSRDLADLVDSIKNRIGQLKDAADGREDV